MGRGVRPMAGGGLRGQSVASGGQGTGRLGTGRLGAGRRGVRCSAKAPKSGAHLAARSSGADWRRWLWGGMVVGAVFALFILAARSAEPRSKTVYLYGTASLAQEAAYCLAAMQRVGEITHGLGPRKLEYYLREQSAFWITRLEGEPMAALLAQARGALGANSHARGTNERAHLHLAVQECGLRSLSLGARLRSMAASGSL